jgi:DNA (cytosine-5)-methyltransferase 1
MRGRGGTPIPEVGDEGLANALRVYNGGRCGEGPGLVAHTLRGMNSDGSRQNGGGQVAVAIQERASAGMNCGPGGKGIRSDGAAYTLEARHHAQSVAAGMTVRRLTPRECERLQGFPDDWTRIPWRGKGPEHCPDGPRYKALGNSMAVNCMRWIGQRIEMVDRIMKGVG